MTGGLTGPGEGQWVGTYCCFCQMVILLNCILNICVNAYKFVLLLEKLLFQGGSGECGDSQFAKVLVTNSSEGSDVDGLPFYTNFPMTKAQELRRRGGRNNLRAGRWEESCIMLTSRQGMSIAHTNSQHQSHKTYTRSSRSKFHTNGGGANRLHPFGRNTEVGDCGGRESCSPLRM